ncbi:hypothetical protein [Streptomyces sp. NPDC051577]
MLTDRAYERQRRAGSVNRPAVLGAMSREGLCVPPREVVAGG